ncbi:MAG TPA: HAD family phosphatase [Candidatus Saccharimonadales bacterium]
MGRPFAVFDIDGTIIRWQMIHATIDVLGREGHVTPETYAKIKQARMNWKNRTQEEGFMAYQDALVAGLATSVKGLPVAVFEQATKAMFDEYKDQVYVYTRTLIQDLKERGYLLFAVSGSQSEAVELLANHYGFDDFVGTYYERENGKLTGNVRLAVGSKEKLVRRLMEKHGADLAGSVGVGDSEGDITMLELVERPVAFNPSKKLFRQASANAWRVVLERKNMIYELAPDSGGYRLERTNA